MAKNPFWLRGARGKFAGSVVQKGENGTVIRENVKPSNPQSNAQMAVRVVFGTLNTAAYWLQKVIGQTFEKTENATMNKRAFVSRNFPALRAQAVLDMQGTQSLGGAFDPKGSRILSPNPYIVSHGSIATPAQLKVVYDEEDASFKAATIVQNINAGSYTAAELWYMLTGLKPGQQMTWIHIETQDGDDVAYDRGAEYGQEAGFNIQRYCEFSSARLVLMGGDGDTITISDQTSKQQLLTCMESLVDEAKTSGIMWNVNGNTGLCAAISLNSLECRFDITGLIDEVATDDWTIQSCGVIISQLIEGSWHYNTCRLASTPPDYAASVAFDSTNFGLKIWEAIDSYRASSSSESELYTRQGGSANVVNF